MERLKQLENHKGVISVYTYVIADEYVPIVVVKNDEKWREMSVDGLSRIIVLTRDEVKDSHDVFALQFVHMQSRAHLVYGKDILHEVEIDQGHLRRHLELLLRQMIIDRRELELVHNTVIGKYERKSVHDRLAVGLSRLLGIKEKDIWTHIDKKLGTNLHKEEDVDTMYHNYLGLLDFVDTLENKKKKKSKDRSKKKKN